MREIHRNVPVSIDGIDVGLANVNIYHRPRRIEIEMTMHAARDDAGNPLVVGGMPVLVDPTLKPGEIKFV